MGLLIKSATPVKTSKGKSDWTSVSIPNDLKAEMKKISLDGKSVKLLLGDDEVASDLIDTANVTHVTSASKDRDFISLIDRGGRSTLDSGHSIKVGKETFRVKYRFTINLEKE